MQKDREGVGVNLYINPQKFLQSQINDFVKAFKAYSKDI